MQCKYKRRINNRFHAPVRSVRVQCTPTFFRQVIWSHLHLAEKQHEPHQYKSTYRANLLSTQHLAVLVGLENVTMPPGREKVFIAVKRYALTNWHNSSLDTASLRALQLSKRQYVAILIELPNNMCFG